MAKFISEFINYRLRGSYVELVPEKMWAGPPTSPYGGRTWKDAGGNKAGLGMGAC